MFSRILTANERSIIGAYLKKNGAKEHEVRMLATRCRQYSHQITDDLELIKQFMAAYEK